MCFFTILNVHMHARRMRMSLWITANVSPHFNTWHRLQTAMLPVSHLRSSAKSRNASRPEQGQMCLEAKGVRRSICLTTFTHTLVSECTLSKRGSATLRQVTVVIIFNSSCGTGRHRWPFVTVGSHICGCLFCFYAVRFLPR